MPRLQGRKYPAAIQAVYNFMDTVIIFFGIEDLLQPVAREITVDFLQVAHDAGVGDILLAELVEVARRRGRGVDLRTAWGVVVTTDLLGRVVVLMLTCADA